MNQDKIIENIKRCPRFNFCSHNICPLDPEASQRISLRDENPCPFCLKKKTTLQKGMKTRMSAGVLKFVPISNTKMLNYRNQKRWTGLCK